MNKSIELTEKELLLSLIVPYYVNADICGREMGKCSYLTSVGNKCVIGSMLTKEGYKKIVEKGVKNHAYEEIASRFSQKELFKEEFIDKFSNTKLKLLQEIHDTISIRESEGKLKGLLKKTYFDFFTYEELVEAAQKFKLNQIKE